MKHLVDRQIKGEPLKNVVTVRTEFQLKTKRNQRIVLILANRTEAKRIAEERNLNCYAVTITTEQL